MSLALRPSSPPAALRAKALDLHLAGPKGEWSRRLLALMADHGVTIPDLRAALGTSMRDMQEILTGKRRFGVDQIGVLSARPERGWQRFADALATEVVLFSRSTSAHR